VEEHYRIEAAAKLSVDPAFQIHCRDRVEVATRWLLDELAEHGVRATFFIVGQLARDHPALVRAIHQAGHEVASHGWEHRRIHQMSPETFQHDVRQSKATLEQITGQLVLGYRAPTFSIVKETAWALDILAEAGLLYDSSIYPVWHDRYGVPGAHRFPFRARGMNQEILEIPPATWQVLGANLPVGGGGYFRLMPLVVMERALRQIGRVGNPAVAMLYFHPWEFYREQRRLPLGRFSRFRTYVGISRTRGRLKTLLDRHSFVRAVDVAKQLDTEKASLPEFEVAGQVVGCEAIVDKG